MCPPSIGAKSVNRKLWSYSWGSRAIHEIAREIMKHGRSGDTPAIAVRWGTRPNQETVTGTLATIADRIEKAHLKPPATVIIGEVAGVAREAGLV